MAALGRSGERRCRNGGRRRAARDGEKSLRRKQRWIGPCIWGGRAVLLAIAKKILVLAMRLVVYWCTFHYLKGRFLILGRGIGSLLVMLSYKTSYLCNNQESDKSDKMRQGERIYRTG